MAISRGIATTSMRFQFDHQDRFVAQRAVRAMIANSGDVDVLDPPSLPYSPASPNRSALALAGLGGGLLLWTVRRTLVLWCPPLWHPLAANAPER